MNTGVPQGCVVLPILFSVYTNEVVFTSALLSLVKFADDTALVASSPGQKQTRRKLSLGFKLVVKGMFSGSEYFKSERTRI